MYFLKKNLVKIFFLSFLVAYTQAKEKDSQLITHANAFILSPNAQFSDWNRFNGPFDNATSTETHLIEDWGERGPRVIWEVVKGEGYASPAVSKNILILFHRQNGMETIEGLNSETGTRKWIYRYPVEYRDRYGYSNGPRSSPIISGNFVYAHGVTSWLTCLELKTGKLIWKRDLASEFEIPDYFFGKGSNPILFQDYLIVNVGGSKERCVVAFNKSNGVTEWICKDPWGASYSSPTLSTIHGKEVCLVLTGGESRPPTGGLLAIDPLNGKKLNRFSWRSTRYESANAVPPIPCGGNRVFLSECYEKGGVLLEYDSQFNPSLVWTDPGINIHWMTPIVTGSTLYGIAGRHQQGAEAFALNIKDGKIHWKEPITWKQNVNNQMLNLSLFRGSILKLTTYFVGLSELGSLVQLNLTPKGWKLENKVQLFFAPGTWTLPALSKGLLYVMQNETDRMTGKKPRLLCLDFRSS